VVEAVMWTRPSSLLAVVVILSVASLATVGTYAAFSDIETSQDNYFGTGELNLWLENMEGKGEQWEDSVLRTWHYEYKFPPSDPTDPPWYGRMEPGDFVTSSVLLQAEGSQAGNHIDIYCSNVNTEPTWDEDIENQRESGLLGYPVPPEPNNGIYDKDTVMIITEMSYNGMPIIFMGAPLPGYFDGADNNPSDGHISLDEFEAHPLLGLTPTPNAGIVVFTMTVWFADYAGDEYQGDQTNMTLMFALMQ